MKNIIVPALCALCVMSFSTAALAGDNSADKTYTQAEKIMKDKNSSVAEAWVDQPNQFPY